MSHSREYLEEFVRLARSRLDADAYRTIHARALPSSGGRAKGRDPQADGFEFLGLGASAKSLKNAPTEKLEAAAKRLDTLARNARKRGRDLDPFTRVAQLLIEEFANRGEEDLEKGCRNRFQWLEEQTQRKFPEPQIKTCGPEGAPVAFVAASPSPLDIARGEPLVGLPGSTFVREYLTRLGLRKEDILMTHTVPVLTKDAEGRPRQPNAAELEQWDGWIHQELKRTQPEYVIALGKVAKAMLGDLADFVLPHPNAVRKFGDSGEVGRKLKAISRSLRKGVDEPGYSGAQSDHRGPADGEQGGADDLVVAILKADDAKQIVYGVVLDPYIVDTQNDWTPPADVESSAHDWLMKSRVIGLEHDGRAPQAVPVESWLEPYPTPEDYRKAMAGEPHSAYRRKFGEDVVHSGAWVLGTKIGDGEWARVQAGELGAYSIGGLATRIPADVSAMPKVNFIDIGMDNEVA